MRIDVVTIFPEYLEPLNISLIGKAGRSGLVVPHIHDLRDVTSDRHRSVDDAPIGGGAGMVMSAEIWARAYGAVLAEGRAELGGSASPAVIVPTPAGTRFTQETAGTLARRDWLVFCCGRYEGIDERFIDYLVASGAGVHLLSLGDYVLNGGEVAVLAMSEAIIRLIPGVLGNPESVVEESHTDGLLEYPVYTRPAQWTDPDGSERPVPEVLMSGHHGRVQRWRRDQALARTSSRRPDMVAQLPVSGLDADDRSVLDALGWDTEGARPTRR